MSIAVAPENAARTLDEARAAVRARVEAAGTSFYWAMRVLPEARRDAMFAIYAFCREVDDIADDSASPEAKRRDLDAWRREIDALFSGRPTTTTGRALLEPTRAFDLRRVDFLAVIDGMEMDAGEIRAPSLAELDLYCDRVASAVGRLSVRAFGVPTEAADRVAHALGRALQLTNILRDLAEDGARGRLYLPRELLTAEGITAADPTTVLKHAMLARVCGSLAAMAEGRFVEARLAMRECPRRPMRPAAAMAAVYHAILRRLLRRGWRDLDREVKIPAALKLWFALRYGLM
ncbi:MAG TPA: presqualene diphosphate synthase HpnD [Stellaceae bacterium]|nr:presqualene diphosphate synthase HpnD [Stellaceae bacterium]